MQLLATSSTTYASTRDALQRVAVHIVARARQQATGRFGLRVTAGGFGTPDFGDDLTRVRVSSGGVLVAERAPSAPAARRATLARSTARSLTESGGVRTGSTCRQPLCTWATTRPPLGDVDESLWRSTGRRGR